MLTEYRCRFFCGSCGTPITRPSRRCPACHHEFPGYAESAAAHQSRYVRMVLMSGGTPGPVAVPVTPEHKCSGCQTTLTRPLSECPTCRRWLQGYRRVMTAVQAVTPEVIPAATQLDAMAGLIPLDRLGAETVDTRSKLVTGIPVDLLGTVTQAADAAGISANEWIRRVMAEAVRRGDPVSDR